MPLAQQILRSEGFPAVKFAAATQCEVPKCAICEFVKGYRRPTRGKTHKPTPSRDGHLKVNDLRPGSTISVDYSESRIKGRTFDSFGKATSGQYIGGCIFVGHSSHLPTLLIVVPLRPINLCNISEIIIKKFNIVALMLIIKME